MKTIFLCVLAAVCVADFDLVLLKEAAAEEGAVCLDGSPGGFYLRKSPSGSRSWAINFEGGIQCYRDIDCAARTKENIGSSRNWPSSSSFNGILSEDADENPEFHDWNLVHVEYCDGAVFSGNLDEPFVVDGVKVYSRGARMLKAIFDNLLNVQGMKDADNVLVAGGSAGGQAVTYHANQIAAWMPSSVRIKFAAFSSFFPPFRTVDGVDVIEREWEMTYNLMNMSGSINPLCEKAMGPGKEYRCQFPPLSIEFVNVPYFMSNSYYDSWSTGCIYLAGFVEDGNTMNENCTAIPEWEACHDDWDCSQDQIDRLNKEWMEPLMALFNNSTVLKKDGNGALLYSCHRHVAENGHYNDIKVNGMTIREHLVSWFFSDNEPASKHTSMDCIYETDMTCNPTC